MTSFSKHFTNHECTLVYSCGRSAEVYYKMFSVYCRRRTWPWLRWPSPPCESAWSTSPSPSWVWASPSWSRSPRSRSREYSPSWRPCPARSGCASSSPTWACRLCSSSSPASHPTSGRSRTPSTGPLLLMILPCWIHFGFLSVLLCSKDVIFPQGLCIPDYSSRQYVRIFGRLHACVYLLLTTSWPEANRSVVRSKSAGQSWYTK